MKYYQVSVSHYFEFTENLLHFQQFSTIPLSLSLSSFVCFQTAQEQHVAFYCDPQLACVCRRPTWGGDPLNVAILTLPPL